MGDACIYRIQIRGQVTENDLKTFGPPGLKVEPTAENDSLLTICTDQAGVIGLIRYLHGLGLVFISIIAAPVNPAERLS